MSGYALVHADGRPLRILMVSQAWPSSQKAGVPLAAAMHARMLVDCGCEVDIVGSHASVLMEDLPVQKRFHVFSSGSGAVYAPARVDLKSLTSAISFSEPDIVIAEAWQTALTDAAVDVACQLGVPVIMVSHGVSVHPFGLTWTDLLRALAWMPYRLLRLPRRVRKLSLLTALDDQAVSDRFYDRELARQAGIQVQILTNAPVHPAKKVLPRSKRQRKILCIGYFSRIKNQMAAISLLKNLPEDVVLHFIGEKTGVYYSRCVRLVRRWGLQNRVIFSNDREYSVDEEMGRSMLLLSTSITEALPLVLLEAMASATPFVATPVGAVTGLGCGALGKTTTELRQHVQRLLEEECYWAEHSIRVLERYQEKYTIDAVRHQLCSAVQVVASSHILRLNTVT